MTYSYIEAICAGFPGVQVYSLGDPYDYSSIKTDTGATIPSKQQLDDWITAQIKINMWVKIQQERDRRKAGGVKVGTDWFHSDDPSRIQQLGLVMMGANMPANIMWKTLTGSFVPMTPTLALQIFSATASADQAIFAKAEQHKAAMNASATPESYDYSQGWPLTYGE